MSSSVAAMTSSSSRPWSRPPAFRRGRDHPFSEGLKQLSEEKRLPEAATGLTTGLAPVDRIIKQGLQSGN